MSTIDDSEELFLQLKNNIQHLLLLSVNAVNSVAFEAEKASSASMLTFDLLRKIQALNFAESHAFQQEIHE